MKLRELANLSAMIFATLVVAGCGANHDAKRMIQGGYQRLGNEAKIDVEDQRARKTKIEDAKVSAEEDRIAVEGMLKSAQSQSNQLDVDLARINRQSKGSAKERAALNAELADIKKQTAAVQKQRTAQASPQELAQSRKKLEELTVRRDNLAGELQRALKN